MSKNLLYVAIAAAGILAGALLMYVVLDAGLHPGAAQVGDTHEHAGEKADEHAGHDHAQPVAGDWCVEHRVPESQCTACNPSLIDGFKERNDWCGGHGLPESHCRLCNPGLKFADEPIMAAELASSTSGGVAQDWCSEHRVPESQCTKCNPDLVAEFKERDDWCGEHGLPESHCRRCNPGLKFAQEPVLFAPKAESPSVFFATNSTSCNTDGAVIQFASTETAARTGIVVEPVLHIPGERELVEVPAEIIFDETQSQLLTTSVPATVVRWLTEPGATLHAGTAIAELESPEMAGLQADYLEALAESRFDLIETQRADSLFANRLISQVEYQQKESEYQIVAARLTGLEGRLRAAGLSQEQLRDLESSGIGSRWLLRAGKSAVLLERQAPLGVQQSAGSAIALIGDPRALWVHGHIRESEAALAQVGQRIDFALDGVALDRVSAEIFWVAQFVDPATRTVAVRARLLENAPGLKAHRFGRMLVLHDDSQHGVLVDKNAIQWEGCCNIAFVQEAPDRYLPRKVTIERGDRSHYRVTSGLAPGEMVVVNGSYLLKTELMKSSLGAGCAGH